MGQRLEFQELLEMLLGSSNVYFQPQDNIGMIYPAIVYRRAYAQSDHADNVTYKFTKRYQVTYIDRDPDNDIVDKLAALPMSTYDRAYVAENLNHDVFNIYF